MKMCVILLPPPFSATYRERHDFPTLQFFFFYFDFDFDFLRIACIMKNSCVVPLLKFLCSIFFLH